MAARKRKKSKAKSRAKAPERANAAGHAPAPEGEYTAATPAPEMRDLPAGGSLFHEDRLLEYCRTKWQYAEWQELVSLDRDTIERDPDRAKIMLLVAAAHSHCDAPEQARACAVQAIRWGCDRKLAARVLISAGCNSLARSAVSLEDDSAEAHFQEAIRLVEPRADARLLGRTRQIRETAHLGLLPAAAALLDSDLEAIREAPAEHSGRLAILADEIAVLKQEFARARAPELAGRTAVIDAPVDAPPGPAGQGDDPLRANPRFSRRAFDFFSQLSEDQAGRTLYLDTKSLPRSGLHYMRDSLESILGKAFSFCEWYNEPGCCRQMPCALTGFASGGGRFSLRMAKSHDFDLRDPVFPTGHVLRRAILVRDPLYILTSWWGLNMLQMNAGLLKKHGVNMAKINYLHERSVVSAAHEILSEFARCPARGKLESFLERNVEYICRFIDKWGGHAASHPRHGVHVVAYENVADLVVEIMTEYRPLMDESAQERLDRFAQTRKDSFSPRADPFIGPSDMLTDHLRSNAALFRSAAERIVAHDSSGILAGAGPNTISPDE